jgi:hypothetical protein
VPINSRRAAPPASAEDAPHPVHRPRRPPAPQRRLVCLPSPDERGHSRPMTSAGWDAAAAVRGPGQLATARPPRLLAPLQLVQLARQPLRTQSVGNGVDQPRQLTPPLPRSSRCLSRRGSLARRSFGGG